MAAAAISRRFAQATMTESHQPSKVLAFLPAAVLGVAGWGATSSYAGWGPLVGGLSGFVGGLLLGMAILALVGYMRAQRSLEERAAPDVRELPPDKALAVLSAAAGAQAIGGSAVLDALAEIREQARDPDGALTRVEKLKKQHLVNPAVTAELARLHAAAGRRADALAAARDAIGLALDGGMNPVAGSLFVEFAEYRDEFDLEDRLLERLARVLEAQGSEEHASWCRAQRARE